jgi:uncharacterized protein YndB with AHSA1/START domain
MASCSSVESLYPSALSGEGKESNEMRVEESVQIDRPPQEVFDYVANPENLPVWSGLAVEVKDATMPLGEGEVFTTIGKFLGRRFETPFQRRSYEPNRCYIDRATGGPIPNQNWIYTFEEVPAGTRLTRAVEGEPGASSR